MKKVVTAAVILVCAAVAVFYLWGRSTAPPEPTITITPAPQAEPAPAETGRRVKVYHVEVVKNRAMLRPSEVAVEKGKDPVETALNRLIGQDEKPGAANPIPRGTRLLGLKKSDGLATVNLSREFRDNFAGGSEGEGLTISAICRTLAQFPEIRRVQILVEGQKIDTLGNIDISEPLDVRSGDGGGN